MKGKLIVILLIAGVSIAIGATGRASKVSKSLTPTMAFQPNQSNKTTQLDAQDIIDGAKNPELIPDRIAYSLLFRLIADRPTDEEKGRIRSFIRQIGIGKPCCKQDPSLGTNEADIDVLINVAEEFYQRASVLDSEAKDIKKNDRPNLSDVSKNRLKKLQQQKEDIVDDLVAKLPSRLSAAGLEKLRKAIKERVKPEIKLKASNS